MLDKTDIALFWSFLKIGSFSFGGGYAMIPLIRSEIVEKHAWATEEDLYEMIALAEITPGPVAVNSATFIGSKIKNTKGAIIATLAVILPSFLIILFLSYWADYFLSWPAVRYAFFGIRACIFALIAHAAYRIFTHSQQKDFFFYILLLLSFISVFFFHFNVFLVLLSAGILGILGRKEIR